MDLYQWLAFVLMFLLDRYSGYVGCLEGGLLDFVRAFEM